MSHSLDLSIDPDRAHAQGPLAVLFNAPDRDILAHPALGQNTSPSRSNSNSTSATSSPRRLLNDLPESASAQSPSRFLLSAFQAASPRNTVSSVGLRGAGVPNQGGLQPASPISSPRRSGNARFDSVAFRALNGAASPQANSTRSDARTRTASSSSRAATLDSASTSTTASHTSSAEEPTWQVYRDPVIDSSAASNGTSSIGEDGTAKNENDATSEDNDEIHDEDQDPNQENIRPVPTISPSRLRNYPQTDHIPAPSSLTREQGSGRRHRRSTLSNSVSLPNVNIFAHLAHPTGASGSENALPTARDVTPPPMPALFSQAGSLNRPSLATDVFGTPIQSTAASVPRPTLASDPDEEGDTESLLETARAQKRRRLDRASTDEID